jgi:methionyl aminopeptidase
VIVCRSAAELQRLREVNQLVGSVLELLRESVSPGVTTEDLDALAEREIRAARALPAFKGYKGYPATICASVNEQVVHGIPSAKTVLIEGDIVSIDLGARLDGFFGDSAITVGVGRIAPKASELLRVTEESLWKAIEVVRAGLGYRARGADSRGAVRLLSGARVRGPRHRVRAPRGAPDSQLRRPRPGAEAGRGHGARD